MNRTAWIRLLAISTVLHCCGAFSQAQDLPVVAWEGRTMGSPYTVKVVGTNLTQVQVDALKAEVEDRLTEVNRQMSHYQPDSELSRFKRCSANVPFKVSPEFARVVRFSLEVDQQSGGAFDPTLAPVVNLWGFGEKSSDKAVPSEAELRAAMARTGRQHLSVTAGDELVKDIPDLTINLSGAAKGFGVDQMVGVLRSHGFANIYAAIAGEVRVLGHNSRGTKWQIGISVPMANWRENDPMAAVVSLSDQAISTSGDYQKFFTDAQGRRLCHIIDPKTGWPVQHNVGGVSVVAPDSMTADAMATTLFVMGVEKGLRFVDSRTNTAALFIVREAGGEYRQILSSRFTLLTGYQP